MRLNEKALRLCVVKSIRDCVWRGACFFFVVLRAGIYQGTHRMTSISICGCDRLCVVRVCARSRMILMEVAGEGNCFWFLVVFHSTPCTTPVAARLAIELDLELELIVFSISIHNELS